MSEMRKSVRSKRQVDYSKLAANDSDDDFADSTPPLKKIKNTSIKEKKTNRKKSTETVEIIKTTSTSRSSRPSLDDRGFDSDLEAALRLSLCDTNTDVHGQSTDQPDTHKSIDRVPILPHKDIRGQSFTDGEEIEFLSSEDQNLSRRRCASKPPVVYVVDDGPDDDEDGQDAEKENRTTDTDYKHSGEPVDSDSSSSDDDDDLNPDDSDGDFGESTKKPAVKKSTDKKTPVKSFKPAITPVATSKAKISSSIAKKSGSSVGTPKTPILPVSRNRIQTTPSSLTTLSIVNRTSFSMKSPLSGVSLKSPSSGLRLGLSRNQKVKSLHSCTNAQT